VVTTPPGPSAATTVGGVVLEDYVPPSGGGGPPPPTITLLRLAASSVGAPARGRGAGRASCACSGPVPRRACGVALERASLSRGQATVTLTSALRRRLKRGRSLKAAVTVKLRDGNGVAGTVLVRS